MASFGERYQMSRAVFIDRDGVLNPLVYNLQTGEYESPNHPEDFSVYPGIISPLHELMKKGYLLFLISNQPSYAKGKTSLEDLKAVHALLDEYLRDQQIYFREYFYCYHHPEGRVPEVSGVCECRKPKPYFLKKAALAYGLNLTECWMIGDQDSDVYCGQNAGVRTIQIANPHAGAKRGKAQPDFKAANLAEAVRILLDQ